MVEIGIFLALLVLIPPVLSIVAWQRVGQLRERVTLLEQRLAALQTATPIEPAQAAPPAEPLEEAPAPAEALDDAPAIPPPPVRRATLAERLEALATGRSLAWIGAGVLALGVAFLVKVSIDEGLLGPGARVLLGGLFGLGLIVAGIWLTRRQPEERLTPQALVGAGLLSCYLAVWAAFALYALLPPLVAFALLAAISFVGFGLAWILDEPVAWLGLIGAFAVPAIVNTGNCDVGPAAVYLAAVLAAAEAATAMRRWRCTAAAARIATAAWAFAIIVAGCPDGPMAGLLLAGAAAVLLGLARHAGPPADTRFGRVAALVPPAGIADLAVILAAALFASEATAGAVVLLVLAAGALWLGRTAAMGHWLPALPAAGLVLLAGFWPEADPPWLLLAAGILLYGIAGFFQAGRDALPLLWAGYAVVVPLTLATAAYLQAGRPVDGPWPLLFLGLAAAALGACAIVARARVDARSDAVTAAFACGVSAGTALAAAALFRDAFLTAALALQLPVLAWAWQRWRLAGLVPLAAVVAALVALRTLVPPVLWFLGESGPSLRAVAAGWALPALAAGVAAWAFPPGMVPRWAARLFATWAPLALAAALAALAWGIFDRFVAGGLTAAALVLIAALLDRWPRLEPETARDLTLGLGGLGIVLAVGFPLLADNPALSPAPYGWLFLLSGLAGYGLAAAGLAACLRRWPDPWRIAPAVTAGLLLLAWSGMEVRAIFRGDASWLGHGFGAAELYAYSAVWLTMAVALLGLGLWRGHQALRIAGLALLAVVAAKVFLVDMSELRGIWRALSFIGLGLTLVGIGYAFRRVLTRSAPA